MDGLLYAAISNNMSEGLGSFWKPYLSEYRFPEFYEHPPLAIGLQSLWFRLFGDSFLVERFYSLFTFVLSGIFLVGIWKQLGQSIKTGWLPLILWLSVSTVIWSCANNMLENTMTVFILASSFCFFKGLNSSHIYLFILSGIALSFAVLSKGFVSLYIWMLPFAWFLFTKNINLKKCISITFLIVLFTILPLLIMYFFSEEAAHNFTMYIKKQVVRSIEEVNTVSSRFFIIGNFFQAILVPLGLAVLFILIAGKKAKLSQNINQNKSLLYVFLFIVFCGVVPIMISMKQSGFYILSVYPFVGIILGLILVPVFEKSENQIDNKPIYLKLIRSISFLLFISSLYLINESMHKVGRDKEMLSDVYKTIETVKPNTKLNICPTDYGNFSKHGYFARYGNISLVREKFELCEYFLTNEKSCLTSIENYIPLHLDLQKHLLFKKKN